MLERVFLISVLFVLGLGRRVLGVHPRAYAMLTLGPLQPFLEAIALMRARAVFLEARARCPAYRDFLEHAGYRECRPWRLADVPLTTKESYVKKYSIEQRCYGGELSGRGQVIDESSGSSGLPNNWVRSRSEREDGRRLLQLNYDLMYADSKRILLNCFALGPWATGMNVSMSLADVGILKSIGPDAQKLENTLLTFGTRYRYIVFGYPPFVKSFVDGTKLDLSLYHLDLVVGGEGVSENLRSYLARSFRSVVSSYGASDLEINIGIETSWSIALRAACARDPALCLEIFGRDTPPMIFQYNPLDWAIEPLPEGGMAFTVTRLDGAAPKIQYDLRDRGGTYRFRDLAAKLARRGIAATALATVHGCFPIVYVFGRGDLTVAFFGAKLYPADVEAVVLGDPVLASRVQSFQIASVEETTLERRLLIQLEMRPGVGEADIAAAGLASARLAELFYRGLAVSNQDFREVTRMFAPEALDVRLLPCGTGPFAGADPRIKAKYVASS